ncbi:hypothetical protein [Sporolactobacillus laevolacticus]|uniref:Uncharacterized protein n=1 Tax=Sporolactobacillus laevolacticus DSM 442 TaxID=1395513 RepID=V6IXY7_9BACL|nr:hypothetical protein [Sporolactobacillus laevolacticus]EST12237.1 hypothetical protein P343_08180 [Sporolactobacillus laevolacticus DSM 442]
MLKKWIVASIVFLLFLSSLGNASYAKTVSRHAGIGDTKAAFNKAYGKGKFNDISTVYKHGYLVVMFLHSAYDISLEFESTSNPRRSKQQAINAYKKMIPSDSKLIKQYHDSGRLIMEYRSQKLAKHVKKALFNGSKPGTFIAILKKDSSGYYAVILGTGDNP